MSIIEHDPLFENTPSTGKKFLEKIGGIGDIYNKRKLS